MPTAPQTSTKPACTRADAGFRGSAASELELPLMGLAERPSGRVHVGTWPVAQGAGDVSEGDDHLCGRRARTRIVAKEDLDSREP